VRVAFHISRSAWQTVAPAIAQTALRRPRRVSPPISSISCRYRQV